MKKIIQLMGTEKEISEESFDYYSNSEMYLVENEEDTDCDIKHKIEIYFGSTDKNNFVGTVDTLEELEGCIQCWRKEELGYTDYL